MSLGCFQRFLLNSISKKEYSFSPIPISPPHKIFLQQYPLHYSPYTPPSHILLIFSQLPLPSSFSLFPVVTGGTQDAGERASAAGAPWPRRSFGGRDRELGHQIYPCWSVSALIVCPAARPVQQADGSPPAVVRGAGGRTLLL